MRPLFERVGATRPADVAGALEYLLTEEAPQEYWNALGVSILSALRKLGRSTSGITTADDIDAEDLRKVLMGLAKAALNCPAVAIADDEFALSKGVLYRAMAVPASLLSSFLTRDAFVRRLLANVRMDGVGRFWSIRKTVTPVWSKDKGLPRLTLVGRGIMDDDVDWPTTAGVRYVMSFGGAYEFADPEKEIRLKPGARIAISGAIFPSGDAGRAYEFDPPYIASA